MSVDVARAVPVVTSEVPLLAGDVMREIKTPSVNPPADPLASPTTARVTSPDNTTVANALATRRLSAGAVIAEQIGISLDAIGAVEARKIMSVEHKVLGFRPPHGSLAAEAQAAAAKHPEVKGVPPPDPQKLKEAAKVDAERILAERVKGENGNKNGGADSVVVPDASSEPVVILNNITEEEARRLMSHEHRALGFRPPPGSLAAEAQAAAAKHVEPGKPRRNSNEAARKPRQQSMTVATAPGTNARVRRGSSENRGKPRQNSMSSNGNRNGKPRARSARRGSNEKGSGERNGANGAARRTSAAAPANKDELLREAALRDAERIKATRGVNGTQVSDQAHVDIKDVAAEVQKEETINLPAPAQSNIDREAKTELSQREAVQEMNVEELKKEFERRDELTRVGLDGTVQRGAGVTETEVAPGELEHEEPSVPVMSRSETADSVEIVGDVLA